MFSKLRIVLATGSLASYPQGGGVWAWMLQYVHGLRALGHDVFLIERLTRDTTLNQELGLGILRDRLARVGLAGCWAVLVAEQGTRVRSLDDLTIYGVSEGVLRTQIREADVLWNFARTLGPELLGNFRRTVLVDVDPGVLQLSALVWDMNLDQHDVLMTCGSKINDPDCQIPTLGLEWLPFFQPVYLPAWDPGNAAGELAPVTSITQWNWGKQFRLGERVFSDSKREAYLRYLDLPRLCQAPLTLAANFDPYDSTREIELLKDYGWRVVDPHRVAGDPNSYGDFIYTSSAELGCAKPIYVDLKTGWFSERSATYLACGRPVVAENTGFPDHIETGLGLLTFSNPDEAAGALDNLRANYPAHREAAIELAATYFSADRVLARMVEASF